MVDKILWQRGWKGTEFYINLWTLLLSSNNRIAKQYDSYCFDNYYEKKVFSTYSVNNFLQDIAKDERVVFGDY